MPLTARPAAPRWAARLARRAALAAAPLTLALAGACTDATAPETSAVGVYTLVAYDNRALPGVVDFTPGVYRSEVTDGELDLRAGGRFTLEVTTRDTDLRTGAVDVTTATIGGDYAVRGSTVTFRNTPDGALDGDQATLSGNTLRYAGFTFRR